MAASCQKETHAAQQRSRTDLSLFDHFVGDGEQAGRLLALEDSASIDTGLTKRIRSVWAVAHESASRYEFAPDIGGGNPVARRQRNKLGAPIVEKWIGGNDQGIDVLLIYGSESSLEVAFAAGIQDMNLAPERVDRRFQFCELRLADRIMWICKHSNGGSCGNQLKQKPQPLCRKLGRTEHCDARDITAGSINAGDYPEHHRVATDDEDNWNDRGRRLR